MSHYYFKTKYNTEGDYGSINEEYLYSDHNTSNDYVTFYDQRGNIVLVVPDTLDNNILDAINRAYAPFKPELIKDGNKYADGVENMTIEEINDIIKNKK